MAQSFMPKRLDLVTLGLTMREIYVTLPRKLLPYVLCYRWRVVGVLLTGLVLAAIGGWQIALIRSLFDEGLAGDADGHKTYAIAAAMLALGLVNFPCRFFHFYWLRYIMDQATCQVRTEIFEKLMRLPVSRFGQNKQGQFVSHIVNDAQVFAEGFKSLMALVREPLKAAVYLGMALWADWVLTSVMLVVGPFFVLVLVVSARKVRNNQWEVQREHGELTHHVSESLSGGKIIKAFNLEAFAGKRFGKSQEDFFNKQMKTTLVEEMAHPFVELLGAVAFSGVVVFAHYRMTAGAVSTGDFVAFITALALFMQPIRSFSQANVKLGQSAAAGKRIQDVMDWSVERGGVGVPTLAFERELMIDNLSFSYAGTERQEVIRNLNMVVRKGEKIGLAGLSGSGKSTLVHLLLGFYPIKKGEIRIDGRPIQEFALGALRDVFGLVGQDIFLFHDTIRENLTLGKNYSPEQIQTALRIAYADEFVDRLPEGLETVVGERGTRLSGGQQQRLTIARAFLKDCDILLFDEATSSLDNESEKVVQKALGDLAQNKTVLAIAHRLTSLQHYDRIYVMKEGGLVEVGSHQELLEKGGEYARLYQLGHS